MNSIVEMNSADVASQGNNVIVSVSYQSEGRPFVLTVGNTKDRALFLGAFWKGKH